MYDSLLHDHDFHSALDDPQARDPALDHCGEHWRLLQVHREHAAALARGDDVRPIGPLLLKRIGDTRTIKVAMESLRRAGRRSPGPGGVRLETLSNGEQWDLARQLSSMLKNNLYRPGRAQVRLIPKAHKPGEFRKLTIQSTADRIVGKTVALILEPLVEPTFSPFSFGFRPRIGRLHALAAFLDFARRTHAWYVVSADMEKAFDEVPIKKALDACRQHFPEEVMNLIELLIRVGGDRGLAQGSTLAPLVFNIFADWFVDQPWQRRQHDLPLFRYVDDLLVACRSESEAANALALLARLALSAGTPLKQPTEIVNVAAGQELKWLGYLLRREANRLAIRIAPTAWSQLGWNLAKAHLLDASPLRAIQVVRGWIDQVGPCYAFEDRDKVLTGIRDVAAAYAFDEIPSKANLSLRWAAAHGRWHRLYGLVHDKAAAISQSNQDGAQADILQPIGLL